MTAVGNTLLLFGGKMKNGSLSNQLWLYNISGKTFASALPTISVFRKCLFQKHILVWIQKYVQRGIFRVLFGIRIIFGSWIWILIRIKVKS
jgi:hypothetical protein